MAIETALAKATLTQVELRDPYKHFHKMDARAGGGDDAFLRLGGVLEGERTARPAVSTSPSRRSTRRWNGSSLDGRVAGMEDVSALAHAAHNRAPYLSAAFVREDFDFFDTLCAA